MMKTKNWKLVVLLGGFTVTAPSMFAQWAVAVVADPFRQLRWIIEDVYWDAQLTSLEEANALLGEANTLLGDANETLRNIDRRIGEPAAGSATAFASVDGAKAASDDFVSADLSLERVMGEEDGSSTLGKINHSTKAAIGTSYSIGSDHFDRDTARYRLLEQEEKLRETYKIALKDFHEVQKKELEFQGEQAKGLAEGAGTVSEIEARHAAIESSRGRVDLAKNRLELAKGEVDFFTGQLDLEDRKVEAARLEEKDQAKKLNTDENVRAKGLISATDTADEYTF